MAQDLPPKTSNILSLIRGNHKRSLVVVSTVHVKDRLDIQEAVEPKSCYTYMSVLARQEFNVALTRDSFAPRSVS